MLIDSFAKFETAINTLCEGDDPVSWDLETTGKDWRTNRLVGIGTHVLRNGEDIAYYFPFRHREGFNLSEALIEVIWKKVLHPRRRQITWHGSYDTKVAAHHDGYDLPEDGFFEDGILAALLCNENEPSFKMEAVSERYIDKNAGAQDRALTDYLIDRFGGSKRAAKSHLWKAPADMVAPYGCADVTQTRKLRDFFVSNMGPYKLEPLWREYNDFQIDIARMELRGVKINRNRLPILLLQAQQRAEDLLQKIQKSAGYPINPNSPKQVCAWLGVKSSAKAVLQRMADDPRAEWMLGYRQWAKAESTYYGPYTRKMDDFGILRPNLHITTPGTLSRGKWDSRNGTVAGRLSASDPNLQQIPRGSESYRVKELFVARAGYLLVELDASQAELRWAAHYSKDKKLTEILLSGGDMHSIVAEELGIPRHIAKNINFSAWYGIGYRTFARNYYMSEALARDYLSRYHKMFPGIRRLAFVCEERAQKRGYIRLHTGRLRHYNCVEAETRKACNNLIQGSVAEMLREGIMRTRRQVPEARQVLTVHDSIWYEVPEKGAMDTISRLRGVLQYQPKLSLPMIFDAKGGKSFATAKGFPRGTEGIPKDALERITDFDAVFK